MAQECPDCGKQFAKRRCSCGYEPARTMAQAQADRCPFDGSRLETSGPDKGFCDRGGGYPVSLNCAFACPLCGQRLGWSGDCHGCHGTRTGQREDWTFPGDGYYTHTAAGDSIGDGLHYVKQQGPRIAASMAENVCGAKALGRILVPLPSTGDVDTAPRDVTALVAKTREAMQPPDDGSAGR